MLENDDGRSLTFEIINMMGERHKVGYCLQLCSGLDGRNFRNERGLERGERIV